MLVQAYSINSESIAKSLIRAKERGVDVKVILDESAINGIHSVINQLFEHTIPIWIDFKPAIADNKVVIIDNQKIITGSNFSHNAQRRNAENLLIITGDSSLIERYIQNWKDRQSQSEFYNKAPRRITRIWD